MAKEENKEQVKEEATETKEEKAKEQKKEEAAQKKETAQWSKDIKTIGDLQIISRRFMVSNRLPAELL
jgi:hypothetical protein